MIRRALLTRLLVGPIWCSWKIVFKPYSYFELNLPSYSVLLYPNPNRYSVMPHTAHIPRSMLQRLLSFALMCTCMCAKGEMWVVTDHAHPVTNTTGHRVIVLDKQQRLEAHLTSKLPSDQTLAAATIQAYLTSPEGTRVQRELIQAQQGITDAWSVGVEKIPAVVVDRRYVVYGEPDVDKAIALIDRARSTQQ